MQILTRSKTKHINKILVFILSLTFLLTTAISAFALEFGAVYNTTSLNLREEPSSSSTWLGTYPKGTWIEIVDEVSNWYKVKTPDGKSGYMSKNFLTKGSTAVLDIGYVNNSNPLTYTNLRNNPSYTASILAQFYNSTPMLIKDIVSNWYKVDINGTLGFMVSDFVLHKQEVGSNDIATIVSSNGGSVNLRIGPEKKYSSMGLIKDRTLVMVLNRGTKWWKISVQGKVGYMDSDFLKSGIHIKKPTPPSQGGSGSSQSGSTYALVKNPGSNQILNLRQSPSQTSLSLGQYKNNTKVMVLKQGIEWSNVKIDNDSKTGWMMSRYLTLFNLPGNPVKRITHPQKSFVNMRSSEAISNNIMRRLDHGTVVSVLIPGPTWTKILYNNQIGYVLSTYLK